MHRVGLRRALVVVLVSLACQARAQDSQVVMAGASKTLASSAGGEDWIRELPSVKTVRGKIKSTDSRGAAAKQVAAFEVLKLYSAARGGFASPESAPAQLTKVLASYESAQASSRDKATHELTPEAAHYLEQGTPFQLEVLTALLSAESVAQYQASAPFQRQQADEARAARLHEAKQAATGDLNVLGVTLLEPLSLPTCDPALPLPADLMGIGRGAPETCKIAGGLDALPRGLVSALKSLLKRPRQKYDWQPVALADSVCPPWMKNGGSCLTMIAVAEGVAAGALVPTGLDGKTVESMLAAKYKQPAVDGVPIQCGNRRTRDVTSHTVERIWALPGLAVSFHPVSLDCTHGRILIQTSLLPDPPAPAAPAATP